MDKTSCDAQISPDVLFRELAGEAVLLDLKSQRYFGLDPIGTRIWQLLDEQGSTDNVLSTMLDEYDVEEGRLKQDMESFLHRLTEAGLIELRPRAAAAPDEAPAEC